MLTHNNILRSRVKRLCLGWELKTACLNLINTLLHQNSCALHMYLPSLHFQSTFFCKIFLCFSEINREILLAKGPSVRIWPDKLWTSVFWVIFSVCTQMPKQSSACFGCLRFLLWELITLQLKLKMTSRTSLQLYECVKSLRIWMWRPFLKFCLNLDSGLGSNMWASDRPSFGAQTHPVFVKFYTRPSNKISLLMSTYVTRHRGGCKMPIKWCLEHKTR